MKRCSTSLLLLLLSRFSRVRLCATPETAAHQALPFLGFSRQEHWSGLPFPSPMHESKKRKWSHSVLSDPMDCSLPGSSIHGICQARELEWVAIAFYASPLRACIKKGRGGMCLFSTYAGTFIFSCPPALAPLVLRALGMDLNYIISFLGLQFTVRRLWDFLAS